MTHPIKKFGHRGAHAELRAVLALLEQGYEVFRNVSPHGEIDLVAWRTGEPPRLFDVKTVSPVQAKNGNLHYTYSQLTEAQKLAGVLPIYVHHDGLVQINPQLDHYPSRGGLRGKKKASRSLGWREIREER